MFAAEFETVDGHGRRRREPRASTMLEAELAIAGAGRAVCRVLDYSTSGARLQTYSELERGALIWLALPGIGRCAATVVWVRNYEAGVEFRKQLSAKAMQTLTAQ
ncbi:PilZ domain-containing protein [Sphingomonas sp. JC676]|uniref:PilZ domain-containing protein n=1 Tax=Sphingomonas sp. JC676 TaxID=2768065 RepID=UPI00165767D4|nr:PilZ domain-containing protein [Sphingomonas sp. JC676]MBC9031756.1 PilZ domain-containing protein [Sphingomonas sp. JC676]